MSFQDKWNKSSTYIIAEVGNNHEGNFENAKKLVHVAAEAGVDAVKFQTFKTEKFVHPENQVRFNTLKRFQLTYDQFSELAQLAKSLGLNFISTPLDLESAQFLTTVVDALKVASSDNNFWPLLRLAANAKLPLIVSGGLADVEHLKKVEEYIHRQWSAIGHNDVLSILHCVTSYPVTDEDANLSAMNTLADNLDSHVGYSDHTLGLEACFAAVARGARVIEKHITLDNNFSEFRDHKLSADPVALKALVSGIRRIEKMIGTGRKEMGTAEKANEAVVRRSAVANRPLKKGEKLSESDILWIRPGKGIGCDREEELLNKVMTRDLPQGEFILDDHIG